MYTHQELYNHFFLGRIGPGFFFCLQLLLLHDKFGRDGRREQAVVSRSVKEPMINALEDCCQLLAAFYIFAIAW